MLSGPLGAGFQGLLIYQLPEATDHARLAPLQSQPQVLNLSDVALTHRLVLLSCTGKTDSCLTGDVLKPRNRTRLAKRDAQGRTLNV